MSKPRGMLASQEGTILILGAAFLLLIAIVIGALLKSTGQEVVNESACKGKSACPELIQAAVDGNDSALFELIEKGANVDTQATDTGDTPLIAAMKNNQFSMASKLITAHADISLPNRQGLTPLMIAASIGNRGYVRQLLAMKADPNAAFPNRTDNGMPGMVTALMLASENGIPDIAQLLVEAGADATMVDSRGWDSVRYAQEHEHMALAKWLATKK